MIKETSEGTIRDRSKIENTTNFSMDRDFYTFLRSYLMW